ncbi:MAG: hypothetical protein WDN24_00140 [Sphingomonas sp.]
MSDVLALLEEDITYPGWEGEIGAKKAIMSAASPGSAIRFSTVISM